VKRSTTHLRSVLSLFVWLTTNSVATAAAIDLKSHIASQPTAVGAAASVRLRAAGLDPASPSFSRTLATRLTASTRRLRIPKPIAPETSILERLRRAGGRSPALATVSGSAPVVPERGPSFRHVALERPIPFAYTDGYQPLSGPLTAPSLVALQVRSDDTKLLASEPATAKVSLTVADCNISASTAAVMWRADDPVITNIIPALSPSDGNYVALFWPLDLTDFVLLPLGAHSHMAMIGLTYLDATLAPFPLPVTAAIAPQTFDVTVANQAPFITATDFGVSPANSTFAQATVTRVNLGDTPMTGTDILASGIAIGAGYTASAKVVAASSIADVGGDTSPDNQYRGAVATSPSGGRLQTSVAWHIGPGDSLTYLLEWTLTGPYGQRALQTLPLGGPCDS
jgi:hypothetical protein